MRTTAPQATSIDRHIWKTNQTFIVFCVFVKFAIQTNWILFVCDCGLICISCSILSFDIHKHRDFDVKVGKRKVLKFIEETSNNPSCLIKEFHHKSHSSTRRNKGGTSQITRELFGCQKLWIYDLIHISAVSLFKKLTDNDDGGMR